MQQNAFELHGKENIPDHGILVIPNRLGFDELLHLEKFFSDRKIVFLIEKDMVYDPLLHAHIEKPDVYAIEFSSDPDLADAFKKELHKSLAADELVVFVPGLSQVPPRSRDRDSDASAVFYHFHRSPDPAALCRSSRRNLLVY